jgi:hypothetical protein
LAGTDVVTKRRLSADFDPRAHPTLYVVNTHLVSYHDVMHSVALALQHNS